MEYQIDAPGSDIAVRCRGVTKSYGRGDAQVMALRGVDLDVRRGELLMIVGPSGCGETTLISVIAGVLDRDSGQCVAVWVGYIALFGIAVETGVVMVVYLHEALQRRIADGVPITHDEIHAAAVEGAVHRLRPKLMTVTAVLASLAPILAETGIGSDVMKPLPHRLSAE